MHSGPRDKDGPTTFATQSDAQAAGRSLAGLLHPRAQRSAGPIDMPRLNEAFNDARLPRPPLYAIIASQRRGREDDGRPKRGSCSRPRPSQEAVAFRKTVARAQRELGDDWFFGCWQVRRGRRP